MELCAFHALLPAVACCSECGTFLCSSCNHLGERGFEVYCPTCRGADEPAIEAVRPVTEPQAAVGFGSRLLAVLVDLVLLDLTRAGVHLVLGLDPALIDGQGQAIPSAVGLALAVYTVYHVIAWARYGATIGKALLGLKVVRADDGGPIGLVGATLRWLGYCVSYLPFFVGFLAILWDPQRRGWHDRLAGTRVVRR